MRLNRFRSWKNRALEVLPGEVERTILALLRNNVRQLCKIVPELGDSPLLKDLDRTDAEALRSYGEEVCTIVENRNEMLCEGVTDQEEEVAIWSTMSDVETVLEIQDIARYLRYGSVLVFFSGFEAQVQNMAKYFGELTIKAGAPVEHKPLPFETYQYQRSKKLGNIEMAETYLHEELGYDIDPAMKQPDLDALRELRNVIAHYHGINRKPNLRRYMAEHAELLYYAPTRSPLWESDPHQVEIGPKYLPYIDQQIHKYFWGFYERNGNRFPWKYLKR